MMTTIRARRPAQKRLFGPRDGNTLIETSLCFMLFMTIFFAIMQFGWGVFNYNFVSYAAREGSRYASTRGARAPTSAIATPDTIQTFVRNQAVAMDTAQLAVTTTWPDGNSNQPGNRVTVTVSYPVPTLFSWFTQTMTITGSSTMRIAN
jgi:Flp pilus assembly protein TadG